MKGLLVIFLIVFAIVVLVGVVGGFFYRPIHLISELETPPPKPWEDPLGWFFQAGILEEIIVSIVTTAIIGFGKWFWEEVLVM
jgi:hypothetical protein